MVSTQAVSVYITAGRSHEPAVVSAHLQLLTLYASAFV